MSDQITQLVRLLISRPTAKEVIAYHDAQTPRQRIVVPSQETRILQPGLYAWELSTGNPAPIANGLNWTAPGSASSAAGVGQFTWNIPNYSVFSLATPQEVVGPSGGSEVALNYYGPAPYALGVPLVFNGQIAGGGLLNITFPHTGLTAYVAGGLVTALTPIRLYGPQQIALAAATTYVIACTALL